MVSAARHGGYLSRSRDLRRLAWSIGALAVALALPVAAQERVEAGGLGLVVRQLSFEGNRFIDDYTIVTSIATSPSSLVARWWLTRWMGVGEKRYLSEDEFRRDVLRVQLL